jgi:hypothetical protein
MKGFPPHGANGIFINTAGIGRIRDGVTLVRDAHSPATPCWCLVTSAITGSR